jgi:hypothetical protein
MGTVIPLWVAAMVQSEDQNICSTIYQTWHKDQFYKAVAFIGSSSIATEQQPGRISK